MSETTVTQMGEAAASKRAGTRERIVRAAAQLLVEGGRGAVTTRAVAEAAGVQAPTIYRKFGDMWGLLDEVASYGFSTYLLDKAMREREEDPVEDLRRGWDLHVEFGLANPALYTLMYGYPTLETQSTAASEAAGLLRDLVQRIAEAGRLRVGVERAAQMIQAAGCGVTLTLIGTPPEDLDPALSGMTREAVLASVTTDEPGRPTGQDGRDRVANRAVALKAVLSEAETELTPGEQTLLSEWLDRLS